MFRAVYNVEAGVTNSGVTYRTAAAP